MEMNRNHILWGPIFRRDLTEEERDLFSLLGVLDQFSFLGDGSDDKVWIPSKDGAFSVASFFLVLVDETHMESHLGFIWKLRIPPRVVVFGWLATCSSILIMDNLMCRNVIIVNACPLCLQAAEFVDHLLLGCEMAQVMWRTLLNLFGCQWVIMPSRFLEYYLAWRYAVGTKRGRIMWRLSFMAGICSPWKVRNA